MTLATCTCRNPNIYELFRMQHGLALLATWTTANTLVNIIVPQHMPWFIHGAGYIEDHYDYSDPQYNDTSVRRDESRECVCDHEDAEGIACDFTGTPAEVGVHKYYCHGIGNPAKALVFSNECPGCRKLFANVRSAKGHARRALARKQCGTHRVSTLLASIHAYCSRCPIRLQHV